MINKHKTIKKIKKIISIIISVAAVLPLAICFFGVSAVADESAQKEANKMQNIAVGKQYTIKTGEPIDGSYGNYQAVFYNNDMGQLTDGRMAKIDSNDNGWYRAMRGGSRIVLIDLGAQYAVSSVEASFFHSKAEAFYAPRVIKCRLSTNGKDFMTVGSLSENDLSGDLKRRVNRVISFDNAYEARYVEIEYSVDIFAACDEIRVMGDTSGERVTIVPDGEQAKAKMSTDILGASSFIKLYNGYYPEQELADITKEKVMPYIAYIDENGNIADTLFDGVIFVPCHTDYPSGGRLTKTSGKKGAVMSDWLLYADNTFDETKNLAALDEAVSEVFDKLGKQGKMPVMLTMPYPTVLDGAFGDIDGDGESEYCKTLDERLDIIKWFADLCSSRFADAEYQNLTFAGFYWYREEVNYSDTDHEAELCRRSNDYFHSMGLKSIFDPFYLSTGYDHYRELGFDTCVMQPNYAEISSDREYFKEGMLAEFAQTVEQNGCGVEIETLSPYAYTDGGDYLNASRNYLEYLYQGVRSGYDKNLKTWYQGAGPGSIYSFCYADTNNARGKLLRSLYDATYSFIKGTLAVDRLTIKGDTSVTGEKSSRIRGEYTVSGGYTALMKYTVSQQPKNGVVDAYAGGFKYVPLGDFVGEDEFEITVSDGISESAVLSVKVTVTDTAAPEEPSDDSNTSNDDSIDDQMQVKKDSVPWWPFALAVAAVLSAVAVIAIKKKKK